MNSRSRGGFRARNLDPFQPSRCKCPRESPSSAHHTPEIAAEKLLGKIGSLAASIDAAEAQIARHRARIADLEETLGQLNRELFAAARQATTTGPTAASEEIEHADDRSQAES